MEDGNYVDMMAGVFMMVCLFAVILAMLAYSALVEKRLSINNAVRNYLYIAEQQGGLTAGNVADLQKLLGENYGCENISVKINGEEKWIGSSGNVQVAYGSQIKISAEMDFPNPLCQVIGLSDAQMADGGSDKHWFRMPIAPYLHYKNELSSTSRW